MPETSSNLRACAAVAFAVTVGAVAVVAAAVLPPPLPKASFALPSAFQSIDASVAGSDAVWRLGRRLFFDTSLSASKGTSCATCHQPNHGWSNEQPKAVGDSGKALAFRAPTLIGAGSLERFGWTGRFPDVASIAFFAMSSRLNMNVPIADLVDNLKRNADYATTFKEAFPGREIGAETIGIALTRFVDSIVPTPAPFDRWITGDESAISSQARRGFAVFNGKGRCAECHSGWSFTDGSFHDVGVAAAGELGRGDLFKTSVKLQHAFKTPTLRNIAERPPYMHDGSKATLAEVIDLYDKGGVDRPSRAEAVAPLHLSAAEKSDLIAFLQTLSSGTDFVIGKSVASD